MAHVYQTVEEHNTSPTSYLFNYRGADSGPGTPLPYDGTFDPVAVTLCWPPSPGVEGPSATAIENPMLTMGVEETVRVNGYAKQAILRANGQAISNQFVYVQQYFDKAFLCEDVNGDVPRTTEGNPGGKKKINLSQAVQSGLLSPYGDFTPTNEGKYILTTLPDADGRCGECAIYVLPTQVVTRDPDEGVEQPVDDIMYTSAPVPDVTLSLLSAAIDAQGALQLQVSARVVDRLSEDADDPAERLQQVSFTLNGQVLEVVSNLPSLSPGSGVLPWQPHLLDVQLQRTITVTNPGGDAFILRAETSENAAGNVGWDEIGVGVGLDTVPFVNDTNPVTIAFAQAPTTNAVDSFQIYFGDRAPESGDPACTESTTDSWVFSGSIVVTNSTRHCTVAIFGPLALTQTNLDTFDAQVTYQLADGTQREILGTWSETGTNTLRFVNTFNRPCSTVPAVWYAQELEGSPKGSFDPILVRIAAPRYLVETGGVSVALNDVPQPIAPFTFSPERYYLVARGDEGDQAKPRLLVVTVTNLPPGLTGLRPENLRLTEDGEDLYCQVVHERREITNGITVALFEDDFKVGRRLFGWAQAPITMDVLLSYYRLLYGDPGLKLLSYFESAGGLIELGDVLGDWRLTWRPPNLVVRVEEDVEPVKAAMLLWAGLRESLGWRRLQQYIEPLENLELFEESLRQAGHNAARAGIAGANIYLSVLSIASEGADLAVTLNDLSERQYAAAIGLLPFVPEGARLLWKRADGTIIHTFTKQVGDRIAVILGKNTRIERLDLLREAIQAGDVTPQMMQHFIEGVGIPRYTPGYNRKLLREQLGTPPPRFKYPQAHHDLPVEKGLLDFFLSRGLDPNKKEYGRWVEGTRKGTTGQHQVWSSRFNQEWTVWVSRNADATAEDIIEQMNRMRSSGRYE